VSLESRTVLTVRRLPSTAVHVWWHQNTGRVWNWYLHMEVRLARVWLVQGSTVLAGHMPPQADRHTCAAVATHLSRARGLKDSCVDVPAHCMLSTTSAAWTCCGSSTGSMVVQLQVALLVIGLHCCQLVRCCSAHAELCDSSQLSDL
jgi:hypothetical protein